MDPGVKKTFASEFLYNPDKTGQHWHSATLMQAAGGDLSAGWYAHHEQEYQEATLVLARKQSGETNWHAPIVLGNGSLLLPACDERDRHLVLVRSSRNHERTEFPKMRRMLESGAATLAGNDVRVFNCSPTSDLECFERITYEAALAR